MSYYKPFTRIIALVLAALALIGLLPMAVGASTIADGSATCEVVPINQRQFLLTINYVKGANIAGFIKVANAMVDQGLV